MKDRSILSILQAGGDLSLDYLHEQALQIKKDPQKIIDEAKEHNFDPNKYKEIITLLANSQYQRLAFQISGLYKAGVIDLNRDFRENNLANLVSLYPHYKDYMDMERLILANPSNEDKAKTTFVHEMFANNCPREAILDYFQKLNKIAEYNPQLINNYLALSNTEGKSINQIIEEKSLITSYLGILDEIKNSCPILYRGREHANAPNIDTHTESVHSSVDQSFTRLALVYAPQLVSVDASESKVSVTRDAKWNRKIQRDFEELEQDLIAIVVNDESIDEFIAPTLAREENKEKAREQFKFKAETALRLIEGLKAGRYGNHYTVMANEEVSCGLTPKEIVAIGYASLKNKDLWNHPEQENLHFMQFIENLYIAKRGYNIDRDEGNEVVDNNKCTGGMVNQVVYGLADHQLVEVKVISTETMEPVLRKKLADRLLKIASSPEHLPLINNWLTTGTLNESLTRLIITELQNDPDFSQEFRQAEIQNIGTRVLNKLGQSELGDLRKELQTKSPEKFPQDMVLSDSLSDKEQVNSFAFEEGKGYVLYLEHLYHLDQNRFNKTLQSILSSGNALYTNDFSKNNLILSLLLASQDEFMVKATKEKLQTHLSGFTQEQKDQYLVLMAESNHIHLLGPLKEAGAQVDAQDQRSGHDLQTALHYATVNNRVDAIAKLVELDAKVNLINNNGDTALHIAASYGEVDAIAKLVELGANVNLINDNGDTALYIAAEKQNLDAIAKLVELGADVNAKNNNGETALYKFAKSGAFDEIAKLVELRADVNAQDASGYTALHIAALHDRVDAIAKLVELGANVNLINNNGETALHIAAKNSRVDAIAKLVALGADINAKNDNGETALYVASANGEIDKIAKAIKQKASDIPKVVTNLIKQASGYIQDDDAAWKLVEAIVDKIDPSERVEMVGKILQGIDNTSRRDRLLSFIPEDERNMARALASPTLWEAVRETLELIHGNSSKDVPKRAVTTNKKTSQINR